MRPKSLLTILIEFYAFVLWQLLPMLAAGPVWWLRLHCQRRQARRMRQARVKRGNPRRNPTVLR